MKKNILSDVKPEHYFWLNDGTAIKNLHELYEAMGRINDEVFRHHVNNERNDFYNWIKDVHRDKKLADKLLKAKTKEEMAKYIQARIEEIGSIREIKKSHTNKKLAKKTEMQKAKRSEKLPELKAREQQQKIKEVEKGSEIKNLAENLKHQLDTTSGVIIALAALIGLVILISLFHEPTITGAAVKDMPVGYDWVVFVSAILIIAIVAGFLKTRKFH